MALIAKEKSTGVSTLADEEFINNFSYTQKQTNCKLCSNQCALSINIFQMEKIYNR